jgi:predicted AlkP superfamily pyrophosphatase or phosphodiesterase
MPRTRVVLLGLDGFPAGRISPVITPRLWDLGQSGGRAAYGVTALPSTTYPGFASLLTGCLPARHGVRSTARTPERLRVPTLFDACAVAGLRTAAVQGDHLMHAFLGTEVASLIWPPGGVVPDGVPTDAHGYPTNEAVLPQLVAALRDSSLDFVFGHLNEADTVGHDTGPDSPESLACYRATDAAVGTALDALAGDWDRTLVVVVSDHDMERCTDAPPIDLLARADIRSLAGEVIYDGGAAVLHLGAGADPQAAMAILRGIPGIQACDSDDRVIVAGARPGHIFGAWLAGRQGFHGGPATARTVALVGGGHPAARKIGATIAARPPHLADWAPTIAILLGLHLPDIDGRDLLT